MANTPMTPDAVVMHAVVAARLSEEGRLKKDGEVIKYTRIALAAVPDGWAKIDGEWVYLEECGTDFDVSRSSDHDGEWPIYRVKP